MQKLTLSKSFPATILLLFVNLWAWTNKDTDSTLPSGCQHIIYTNQYLTGQYAVKGHFNIYLPPSYATDTAHVPVIFHLHGSTNTDWTDLPMAYLLDSLIRAKRIKPMIEVWSDITLSGWYYDRGNGDNEESFFIKGLVPHIDSVYRTNHKRAISGFSMGGAGCLTFTFKYSRQPLFSGAVDFDGAFNDINSTYWDANSPSTLKILVDSIANIRNAHLLIRSWAEGQDFGGAILNAHHSLDSILTAKSIPHFYDVLTVHHVPVLGDFTTDQSKPRKILNPGRIIESYIKIDSMFSYAATSAAPRSAPSEKPLPRSPCWKQFIAKGNLDTKISGTENRRGTAMYDLRGTRIAAWIPGQRPDLGNVQSPGVYILQNR